LDIFGYITTWKSIYFYLFLIIGYALNLPLLCFYVALALLRVGLELVRGISYFAFLLPLHRPNYAIKMSVYCPNYALNLPLKKISNSFIKNSVKKSQHFPI